MTTTTHVHRARTHTHTHTAHSLTAAFINFDCIPIGMKSRYSFGDWNINRSDSRLSAEQNGSKHSSRLIDAMKSVLVAGMKHE